MTIPTRTFSSFRVAATYALLCICAIVPTVSAQEGDIPSSSQLDLLPGVQSPEAASLGRFEEVPVSLYTGVPDIAIPLMASGPVQLGLQYHSGGVRVRDLPSSVGTGWALTGVGRITRVMHGKPDEGGYAAGDGQLVANQGSSPDYVFMKNIYYNIIDAQPDEFFYDFNGKSGRFFYGPDGQVHQEPKTGLDIRKSSNGYWEIVDLNGTVYRFGESGMTERTRNQVNDPFTSAYMAYYVSAWLMTSITSGTGVETAKFAYTPEHLITTNSIAETVSEQIYHYWNEDIKCDSPTKHKITTSEGLNYTRFVASIELPVQDERVDMTYTCGAVGGTPCRLDEATLSYRGLPKERYALAYYDLKHPSDPSHRENRLFLKAVHTFDVRTSGVASSYSLEYNDLYGLPSYDSFAIDHWGFYNGETTNGNKISDCYQSGCLVPDYVLHTQGGGTIPVQGAEREPNESYMTKGILTRIQYPTGGTAAFSFMAHEAGGGSPVAVAGGLRVETVTMNDGAGSTVVQYTYENPNGSSSGVLLDEPEYSREHTTYYFSQTSNGRPVGPPEYSCRTYVHSASQSPALGAHSGSAVVYTRVIVSGSDGGQEVSQFSFAPFIAPPPGTGSRAVSGAYERGHLTAYSVFDDGGNELRRVQNHIITDDPEFGLYYAPILHVYNAYNAYYYQACVQSGCQFSTGTPVHLEPEFGSVLFNARSGWVNMKSRKMTIFE